MEFIEGITNIAIPIIDKVPVLRAIIGSLLVFFVPGFAWSLIFFKKIGRLERFVLSVGLSIALVTLSVLASNVALNIPINGTNALLIILVITAIPLGIFYGRKYYRKKRAANSEDTQDTVESVAPEESEETEESV